MTTARPILASERTAARMLDLPRCEFRRLVQIGALPRPVMVGDHERWHVPQIEAIVSGDAMPGADDDLEI